MVIITIGKFVVQSISSAMSKKPGIVFVLGAPGSGKGTQCERIVSNFGFVHLSAGELLRTERITPGSQYGEIIEQHWGATRKGVLIPAEITCSLLERAMNNSGADRFLIDAFPGNQSNLDVWNSVISDKVELLAVLSIDCSQETCTQRCLNRGRADDNVEVLSKRFITYMNQTKPILDYYAAQGLVHTVKAENSPDEVYEEVRKIFQNLIAKE